VVVALLLAGNLLWRGVGGAGQARLSKARVMIVGAGGLGCPCLSALAGAGVGQITLVDPDRIEETNLHRQLLYTPADLGQAKAQVAAKRAMQQNPLVPITPLLEKLTADNLPALAQDHDLLIDCADSFAVTYTTSDHALTTGQPFFSASALGLAGYVGGFCGTAPSYRAVFPEPPGQGATCDTAGVLGPVPMVLGAMLAQMVLGHLLGLGPSPLGQMLRMDFATGRFNAFRFDGATEPRRSIPFVGPKMICATDTVIDLRQQNLPDPLPRGRLILACRSGLRAWRVAENLNHPDLALMALGDD
jgi:molybdopterin/thiamine biosynthesis adenylyltransferase